MIADLKPYPEYQETESRWLGHVPSNWSQRKLLTLSTLRVERNPGNLQLLSVFLNRGVIPYNEGGGQVHAPSLDLSKYQVVYPGDFVLNNQQAWRGSVGVSRYHGIISPAYIVLRLSSTLNSEYTNYLMQSAVMVDQFVTASKGVGDIQRTIYWPYLKTAQIPLPPPDEQAGIVRFLNHTNQRIERTIRAKRKIIALLNEQKQVIIHRAVTRGLDPKVRLKPSGIPWLGEIPEGWELIPLKGACDVQSGITLGKYYGNLRLREYPYLRVANVQSGHLSLRVVKKLRLPSNEARRSLLAIGDVLMTEGGDPDKLGRGCVWDGQIENCVHQNHVFAVRPNIVRLQPYYLSALLGSNYAKTYFLLTAKQTTNLASTNKTTIGRFRVPLPPIEEQQKILDGLEVLTSPISLAIDRTEREIDLLREYRTRLIADVVTGKLDVREAAALVPDEIDGTDDTDFVITDDIDNPFFEEGDGDGITSTE
ncbi:MAG: restriction endonuclease subunit S [Desulfuromonadales bacterium]